MVGSAVIDLTDDGSDLGPSADRTLPAQDESMLDAEPSLSRGKGDMDASVELPSTLSSDEDDDRPLLGRAERLKERLGLCTSAIPASEPDIKNMENAGGPVGGGRASADGAVHATESEHAGTSWEIRALETSF